MTRQDLLAGRLLRSSVNVNTGQSARKTKVTHAAAPPAVREPNAMAARSAAADCSANGNLAHRIAGDGGEDSGYCLCSTEIVRRQTRHGNADDAGAGRADDGVGGVAIL